MTASHDLKANYIAYFFPLLRCSGYLASTHLSHVLPSHPFLYVLPSIYYVWHSQLFLLASICVRVVGLHNTVWTGSSTFDQASSFTVFKLVSSPFSLL